MPVTATPSISPKDICCDPTPTQVVNPAAVACAGQYLLSAPVSTVRGRQVLTRMQAIVVQPGQKATIRWQMKDREGLPVNLRDCLCLPATSSSSTSSGSVSSSSSSTPSGSSSSSGSSAAACPLSLKFILQEYVELGRGSCRNQRTVIATTTEADAAEGWVEAELEPRWTREPGVYFGEMAVVGQVGTPDEYVLFSNTFYVHIPVGPRSRRGRKGPPSIAEIRLHLRDSDPRESYLLDHLRFDDAEIALATGRPVEQWNELPPDLGRIATTSNFPYRQHWLDAIVGNLFLMVAEQFRANNLRYSAAGVTLDDQDKEMNYEQAAARRLAEWKEFVKRKKAALNLENGYGGLGSPYDYGWH